jgi:hypothetical protein
VRGCDRVEASKGGREGAFRVRCGAAVQAQLMSHVITCITIIFRLLVIRSSRLSLGHLQLSRCIAQTTEL